MIYTNIYLIIFKKVCFLVIIFNKHNVTLGTLAYKNCRVTWIFRIPPRLLCYSFLGTSSASYSTSIYYKLKYFNVPVPLSAGDKNFCDHLIMGKCPTQPGEKVIGAHLRKVKPSAPKVRKSSLRSSEIFM